MKLAMIDLSRKASNALQSAIDLSKLKGVLPNEFKKFNMTVVSTRFLDHGGHAIAEIDLVAKISKDSVVPLLQQTSAKPETKIGTADAILSSGR